MNHDCCWVNHHLYPFVGCLISFFANPLQGHIWITFYVPLHGPRCWSVTPGAGKAPCVAPAGGEAQHGGCNPRKDRTNKASCMS